MLSDFLLRYAKRVEKDPRSSLVWEHDLSIRDKYLSSVDEGILAELRKAQCCVEECDLGNFQQFQESLRQLAETINGGE